jgi:prohibitin 2
MSLVSRYVKETKLTSGRIDTEVNAFALVRDIGIGVAVLIFALYLWPVNTVSTGTRGVVTRGGKIIGIEQEGWVLLPPWEHLQIFNIRAETAKIDNAVGGTSDQQPVTTSLVVRYSIEPNKVAEVYEQYSHDGDLSSYVDSATHETFKAVTAKFTAPDLLNKRQEVSNEVKALLAAKLAVYGAQVIQVDMTKFEYDPAYQKVINTKVQQDQLLQTAQKQLLTVNAEQQQKVEVATAEANAVKAKADGDNYATKANADADAYAKLKNATAEAESLKIQNAALAQNRDVLELRRIEVQQTIANNWKGVLPEAVYGSAPIPFLPAFNTAPSK